MVERGASLIIMPDISFVSLFLLFCTSHFSGVFSGTHHEKPPVYYFWTSLTVLRARGILGKAARDRGRAAALRSAFCQLC